MTFSSFYLRFRKWMVIIGLFLVVFSLSFEVVSAQTNFTPPSALPGQNANLGGYGNICVGLATLIRTGDITLRHLPCFIQYFSQTLIAVAGSLSVIFVMVGGYTYTLGGPDEKEKSKKTITNALIGVGVSLLAWIIVDIVLRFVTG